MRAAKQQTYYNPRSALAQRTFCAKATICAYLMCGFRTNHQLLTATRREWLGPILLDIADS